MKPLDDKVVDTVVRSRRSRWPSRRQLEAIATIIIASGFVMLLQPFSLALYGYSFVTTIVGTALFTVVSKLPE